VNGGLGLGRIALAAIGLAAIGYGLILMTVFDGADLVGLVFWLAGGVILHDIVLAPVVHAVTGLSGRLLPHWARTPVLVGFVVLGSVTLLAVPVLGRFGADHDPANPTLLDRNYAAGWLVVAGTTVVLVTAEAVRRRRACRRDPSAA
jgi:hypothetical protein